MSDGESWMNTGYVPELASEPIERVSAVLTPPEAGRVLSVPAKTVVQLCREGHLRARKVGRQWRIPRQAIAEFFDLAEHCRKDDADPPVFPRSDATRRGASDRKRFLHLLRED
jgi:excisionase family DNA binding protein